FNPGTSPFRQPASGDETWPAFKFGLTPERGVGLATDFNPGTSPFRQPASGDETWPAFKFGLTPERGVG
ncbi:hypothetical protein CJ307_35720, partial [Klebsiella quasipneumoniae]